MQVNVANSYPEQIQATPQAQMAASGIPLSQFTTSELAASACQLVSSMESQLNQTNYIIGSAVDTSTKIEPSGKKQNLYTFFMNNKSGSTSQLFSFIYIHHSSIWFYRKEVCQMKFLVGVFLRQLIFVFAQTNLLHIALILFSSAVVFAMVLWLQEYFVTSLIFCYKSSLSILNRYECTVFKLYQLTWHWTG